MGSIEIIFWLVFTVTAIGAVLMTLTRKILYAAYLLLTILLSLSVFYLMFGAEFAAIVQILIYSGGILVLIIFGLMLTGRGRKDSVPITLVYHNIRRLLLSAIIFVALFAAIRQSDLGNLEWVSAGMNEDKIVSTQQVGKSLMLTYVSIFELAGILLLVAFVGSAVIAAQRLKIK